MRKLFRTALFAASLFCAYLANAATLIGSSSLYGVDDLTVIQTSTGDQWEWLDLPTTLGLTATAAESTYQVDGFRWASNLEVTELLDAFGITYSSVPSGSVFIDLGITPTVAQNFVDFLGITTTNSNGTVANGWVDDPTSSTGNTQVCIGLGCNPDGFVANPVPDSAPTIGAFLVRDATVVPLPAAAWLFGSALIGLVGLKRRK